MWLFLGRCPARGVNFTVTSPNRNEFCRMAVGLYRNRSLSITQRDIRDGERFGWSRKKDRFLLPANALRSNAGAYAGPASSECRLAWRPHGRRSTPSCRRWAARHRERSSYWGTDRRGVSSNASTRAGLRATWASEARRDRADLPTTDIDDHALTVDLAHFQQRCLCAAQCRWLRAPPEACDACGSPPLDQSCYRILTEYSGQGARLLWERQIVESQIAPLQRFLIQKPQGGDAVLHRPQCQLPFVQQIELIASQLCGAQVFGRAAEILGKLLDRPDVTADPVGRVVAPPEIVAAVES
jgi:hypothetical protein